MKKICICIKMHFPVSQTRYRFLAINNENDFYNDVLIKELVNKLSSQNILPLLETILSVFNETGGKFKIGISVSGITLSLLQKLRPDVIELLHYLYKKGAIEFFSEPWSHSIMPFITNLSLLSQIKLHDDLIKSEFNQLPKVFFLHSPIAINQTVKFILDTGKKAIFTNHNNSENMNSGLELHLSPMALYPGKVFMVDYKLSKQIEYYENKIDMPMIYRFASRMIFKIKYAKPQDFPLVICYNPINLNFPFNEKHFRFWTEIISQILLVPDASISLPSELVSNHVPGINGSSIKIGKKQDISDE